MTAQEIDKRFAELAGICWHEWGENRGHQGCNEPIMCLKCWGYPSEVGNNPNFCGDPRLVLEVMMKRVDFCDFMETVGYASAEFGCSIDYHINICYMIDTTGKLALKGIEWLQQQNERSG